MPDSTVDNRTLFRQTLFMMGAMVGACVVLVGTLTLVASTVVGRAVSSGADVSDRDHGTMPAPTSRSAAPGASPQAKRPN